MIGNAGVFAFHGECECQCVFTLNVGICLLMCFSP